MAKYKFEPTGKVVDTYPYLLLSKDTPLASFVIDRIATKTGRSVLYSFEISSVEIINQLLLPKRLQYYIQDSKTLDEAFARWLRKRKASEKRPNALAFLNCAGSVDNRWRFIEVGYCTSLNDTYWIAPQNGNLKWSDVSPYKRPLDKEVAEMALTIDMNWEVFTNTVSSRVTPEPTTTGALRKCWVNDNDTILLRKGDWFDTRYHNEDGRNTVTMEYYAAQVAEAMGLPHVPYDLNVVKHNGKYVVEHNRGYEEVVCECPLFTSEDVGFISAADVLRDPNGNINPKWLKLMGEDIGHSTLSPIFGEPFYKDMRLFDFIIMNTDRHLGNFGMLVDNNTGEYLGPAPLFDNGYSELMETQMINLNYKGWWEDSKMKYCMENKIKTYCLIEERHIPVLNKLTEFEFKSHPMGIGIEADSLSKMSKVIQERAKFAIRFWEHNKCLPDPKEE